MPYFINTWRTPRPDQYLNVVKGAKESLERTGRPGNITTTVSHPSPAQTSMGVIGTVAGFQQSKMFRTFWNLYGRMKAILSVWAISGLCVLRQTCRFPK